MRNPAAVAGIALAVLVASFTEPSVAQPYPNKPIRIVIPWPAGGITDVITRGIALRLTEVFGQPIGSKTGTHTFIPGPYRPEV